MLKLNPNKQKELVFETEIVGVAQDQIKGSLKIDIDGVHYGFPITMKEGKLEGKIPVLSEILKRDFKDKEILSCSLEVHGNGQFHEAWSNDIQIDYPAKIEAKIDDDIQESDDELKPFNIKVGTLEEKEIVEEKVDEKVEEKKDEKELTEGLANYLSGIESYDKATKKKILDQAFKLAKK